MVSKASCMVEHLDSVRDDTCRVDNQDAKWCRSFVWNRQGRRILASSPTQFARPTDRRCYRGLCGQIYTSRTAHHRTISYATPRIVMADYTVMGTRDIES